MPYGVQRARRAFVRVGLIAPLMLLALSLAVTLAWVPQLPDPIAIHWSGSSPDGFAPRWTAPLLPLMGAALVALMSGTALIVHRGPEARLTGGGIVRDESGRAVWSVTARFLGAVSLGLGAMMATLSVGTAWVQRGLSDAADAPGIGGWALLAFALQAVASVLGWFLQPKVEVPEPRMLPLDETPIAPSENVAWLGAVSMARSGRIVLGSCLALLAVLAVVTLALDELGGGIVLASLVLVLLAVSSSMAFRVRVNRQGLRVRSLIGWPNTFVPLAEIEKVEPVDIDPFGEFGGWGWRYGFDGRRGVVMRKGEALQVTYGGKKFVVTVDGAAEAAAVLEGLRAIKA